jgi:hypothetical protein
MQRDASANMQVFIIDFEPGTMLSLKRCKPSSIIACCGNIVHAECDHSENVTSAEDEVARVRYALLSPVVDKPCTKEHHELARGLFQPVEAAFEITLLGRAIGEAKGLANVHVLFLWGRRGTLCRYQGDTYQDRVRPQW